MFFSKVMELDKRNGNILLNLWGDIDLNNNYIKIVKLLELLILNIPIEIEFDVSKKELALCDEISKNKGMIISNINKSEKSFGYRFDAEMVLNLDGLIELIKFITIHEIVLDFKCESNKVFGAINDHDGSFFQLPKVIFEENKEYIKVILDTHVLSDKQKY